MKRNFRFYSFRPIIQSKYYLSEHDGAAMFRIDVSVKETPIHIHHCLKRTKRNVIIDMNDGQMCIHFDACA